MRRGPKTLLVALVALLLAVGLVACGGGDSSDSTTAEAAGQTQAESNSSGASNKDDAKGGGERKKSAGSTKGGGQSGSSSADSSDFVPKPHSDSGGGSAQFKVKGGDNSVQEFGGEADTSEFDAASTALHNFLDARAEGNWAATCDYVSKTIIESLEKLAAKAKTLEDKSCAGILEKLTNPAAKGSMKTEAEEADVRSLRIEGEQGFALYTISDGSLFSMPMTLEDGAWKVGSLSGYPLS